MYDEELALEYIKDKLPGVYETLIGINDISSMSHSYIFEYNYIREDDAIISSGINIKHLDDWILTKRDENIDDILND